MLCVTDVFASSSKSALLSFATLNLTSVEIQSFQHILNIFSQFYPGTTASAFIRQCTIQTFNVKFNRNPIRYFLRLNIWLRNVLHVMHSFMHNVTETQINRKKLRVMHFYILVMNSVQHKQTNGFERRKLIVSYLCAYRQHCTSRC